MSTDTLERSQFKNETDTNTDTEPEKTAHIVPRHGLTRAYVMGDPVTALCGKVFVPTGDPELLPLCQGCKDKIDQIVAARRGVN